LKVFPTDTDRASEALADLKELEQADRYRLESVADFSAAFDKEVPAYQEGLRVLWVVNTVDRCLTIAHKLDAAIDGEILTYHSRFRLRDRQKVHARTVQAFSFSEGDSPKPAIAVTTQVCEMSLDLDADVLITEIAPVSSLVQRFGRANRHLKRSFATLHPYMPPANLPYQRNDLETANAFLESFESERVSQLQLAMALETYARPERDADGSSSFLNSGYYAVPGSFRDTDEFAIPCILDSDFSAIEPLLKNRQPYDGFIVNVPHKWAKAWLEDGNTRPEWLPKYLNVVSGDSQRYQVDRGFITKSPEEVELG